MSAKGSCCDLRFYISRDGCSLIVAPICFEGMYTIDSLNASLNINGDINPEC